MVEAFDVEMRRAELGDLETVRSILEEGSAWLLARGVEQWPQRWADEWIRPALAAGDTWLAERDGVPLATITLQWSDVRMWGIQPPDAGYVHRLAVRRAAAGLGARLLAWAAMTTAASGRTFLRLDCWSGNERLRAYYEDAGFVHCGDTSESTWTVARYERQL